MTSRVSRARRNAPEDASRVHIPHSSWTRTDRRVAPTKPIAAEDFWKRLGL